jgi:hypothetical protein
MSNPTSFTIDCGTCVMRRSSACDDCLVTFLCDRSERSIEGAVLDLAEARAVRLFAEAGHVPALRHRRAAAR